MGNLQLFVISVAIWGSTWLAIKFQLGRVAPEASVFYRFLLASLLIFAYCHARRLPLRYSVRQHLWIALFGVLLFGVSYVCVYYAERFVVSGLVAVGYSASPFLGMLGVRIFFGTPVTRGVLGGSMLGIAGIALVFWPEFSHLAGGLASPYGAHQAVAGCLGALALLHRSSTEGREPGGHGLPRPPRCR